MLREAQVNESAKLTVRSRYMQSGRTIGRSPVPIELLYLAPSMSSRFLIYFTVVGTYSILTARRTKGVNLMQIAPLMSL